MRAGDRAKAQDAFMSGRMALIVATNAFGMGIDRPDIRAVVHYDLRHRWTSTRRIGRAGRDGLPADCILLFQPGDRRLQTFFMVGRYPTLTDFALFAGIGVGISRSADVPADPVPLRLWLWGSCA